ncbi:MULTISPECIES: hypothetical protein [unclassified Frankia]
MQDYSGRPVTSADLQVDQQVTKAISRQPTLVLGQTAAEPVDRFGGQRNSRP